MTPLSPKPPHSQRVLNTFRRYTPLPILAVLFLIPLLAACAFQQQPLPISTPIIRQPEAEQTTIPATPAPPTPTSSPTPAIEPEPLFYAIAANVPPSVAAAVQAALTAQSDLDGRPLQDTDAMRDGVNVIGSVPLAEADGPVLTERFYAVVAPFATVRDDVTMVELQEGWSGEGESPLLVLEKSAPALATIFDGTPAQTVADDDLLAQLQATPNALGIVPFDTLDPLYKVLAIDGANVLDNQLDAARYPLAIAITIEGREAGDVATLLADAGIPATNRDPDLLTTLIMTGVTAMSRGTAAKMEKKGYTYPAEVISDTLRSADITHISNEVPFIDGCKVDNSYMNLILCSDYPYWQALEAVGADIIGLSGNHVNDFGREGARESLAFYRERGIPVYGSGLTEREACAPLMWEHNGNTFAFLAALAWWPEEAWATDTEPGACYYYANKGAILDTVRALSDEVDVVSVELQYQETYEPWPTDDQVSEFRELREAGADIVTGVQSHVPQAMEPYGARDQGGPGMIVYGLGNLFFDQMEAWETRTGLIPRHTIYDGRLLSTEILTTVLEDYAQPRWATPEERAGILESIFAAAPERAGPSLMPTPTAAPPPLVKNDQEIGELKRDGSGQEAEGETADEAETASDDTSARHASAVETEQAPPQRIPLSWPAPQEPIEDHYWLARPTTLDRNQIPAATYPFGGTANGTYRVHHGSDIANPTGTPLFAPDAATVVYAGPDDEAHTYGPYPDFFGQMVLFQLDRTFRDQPVYVLYGHMNGVTVGAGDRVERGQQVGTTGMTGIAIGPHVHVEVRLGESSYDDSYNADLWLEPLPGYGAIAGRVLTPDGRAWPNTRIHLYRFEGGGSRLFRILDTYAEDPGIHPDPGYAENFVFANIPAGDYQLVLSRGKQILRRRLQVEPGQTAYESFTLGE